jgi:hypothetical protein
MQIAYRAQNRIEKLASLIKNLDLYNKTRIILGNDQVLSKKALFKSVGQYRSFFPFKNLTKNKSSRRRPEARRDLSSAAPKASS